MSNLKEGQSAMFTVSCLNYSGSTAKPATADKNGKMPVVLVALEGGPLPTNSSVLAGTVAERTGLSVGNTYMISITNGGPRTYANGDGEEVVGTQWNYTIVHTLNFKELREIQIEQAKANASVFTATAKKVDSPFGG